MKAYLAGPEVFLHITDAIAFGEAKKAVCAESGIEGVFPLDGPPLDFDADALFHRCLELIGASDMVIANLTPFRGPSMDVGTAIEMGYALGSGKPVFGYTNVTADYRDRVVADGLFVEDFGLVDNLMCEGAVREHGGTVVRAPVGPTPDPATDSAGGPAALLVDLAGFRSAVGQAAEWAARRQ